MDEATDPATESFTGPADGWLDFGTGGMDNEHGRVPPILWPKCEGFFLVKLLAR
jgi:hypothetical protein